MIEGEYLTQSRWLFVKRHPVLYSLLLGLIGLIILWYVAEWLVSNAILTYTHQQQVDRPPQSNVYVIEQNTLSNHIQQILPLAAFVKPGVKFTEEAGKQGITEISLEVFWLKQL